MGRALGLTALLAVGGCAGVGEHAVGTWKAPHRSTARSWDEVFAQPTALRVTGMVTGEVFTGPRILIDADNPRTPAQDKKERWVPSVVYLVEHPTQGRFVMDTGTAPVETGTCSYGLRPAYWVPCRTTRGQDVVAQLHARGLEARDLRFAMMSHFHGDHAGGLQALAADGLSGVLTTTAEWTAVNSVKRVLEGYLDAQVNGPYGVTVLDDAEAVTMPHVGKVWDVFGDGSVWLIPVAGHTRGQLAALLNTVEGPLLMTFDASHLASNFVHRVVPGSTVDDGWAMDAIERLRALKEAYPAVRVIYGHEPTQWPKGAEQTVLAEGERSGI